MSVPDFMAIHLIVKFLHQSGEATDRLTLAFLEKCSMALVLFKVEVHAYNRASRTDTNQKKESNCLKM